MGHRPFWFFLVLVNLKFNIVISTDRFDFTKSYWWLPECPRGWHTTETSCYKLLSQSNTHSQAQSACQSFQAALLNINTERELKFIEKLITEKNLPDQTWLTSGTRVSGEIWEWKGDGTRVDNDRLGLTESITSQADIYLALKQTSSEAFHWIYLNESGSASSICELPRTQLLHEILRPPEIYGTNRHPKSAQPTLLSHPNDVVHFDEWGSDPQIQLKCEAQGYPKPKITWYKASTPILVNNTDYRSVIQLNGDLFIKQLVPEDYTNYYCLAQNQFGIVRSLKANVKRGYIGNFASSRLDVYAVAGLSKSIACEPPDHYPHTLSFTWTQNKSQKRFVAQTPRVFIASDGTLYFSYLKAEDQNTYSCNVVSNELQAGHYGPFFSLVIDTEQAGVSDSFRPSIPKDFLRVQPEQPMLGRTVRIECFAYGRPTPSYKWRRIGGELGANTELVGHNRVLLITNLSVADLDTYQCLATNAHGQSMAQFELHANAPPRISAQLQSQIVAPNGTAVFDCGTQAVPPVELEWFHDGRPLSPLLLPTHDLRRMHFNRTRLLISNLRLYDSGMYECHARNQFGSVVSSAYLAVRQVAPNFGLVSTHSVRFAVAGGSLTLSCEHEALPASNILWRRNGRILSLGVGRLTTNNGGRKIRMFPVIAADAGLYTCTAANMAGAEAITIKLIVIPQLSLHLNGPRAPLAQHGSVSLQCESDLSCHHAHDRDHECTDATVKWTFNEKPLDQLPQFADHKLEIDSSRRFSSELRLNEVDSGMDGIYMCRIETLAGHATASHHLRVSARPAPTIQLHAAAQSSTTMLLSWKRPPNDYTEIRGYKVQMKRTEPDTEWIDHSELCLSNRSVIDYAATNLSANTEYQFRIVTQSINQYVPSSIASVSSQPIRTQGDAPSLAPQLLAVESRNPGRITAIWRRLRRSDWNDVQLDYKIEFWSGHHKSDESSTLVPVPIRHKNEQSRNELSFDVPIAEGCVLYQVAIRAYNSFGNGPLSDPQTVATLVNAPNVRPELKHLSSINGTHLNVTYKLGAFSLCNPVAALLLTCDSESEPSVQHWIPINTQSASCASRILGGLQPDATYSCALQAVGPTALHGATKSESATLHTPSNHSMCSIIDFHARTTLNNVLLRWRTIHVHTDTQNGLQLQLLIYHGATSRQPQITNLQMGTQSVDLTNLRLQNVYRVKLRISNIDGSLSWAESRTLSYRFGNSEEQNDEFEAQLSVTKSATSLWNCWHSRQQFSLILTGTVLCVLRS